MDCSLPGSPVHEILQARIQKWVAFPFSRGSSWPRDWTCVSHIAGGFFTIWDTKGTYLYWKKKKKSHCFSSVAQSCPTLCDPMNHSTPGLPGHHQLPEFTQTHIHRVSDAIQPSHPLSSPSPPAPNPSQHQGLFQWVNSSHEVAKVIVYMNSNLTGCLLFLFAKSVNHRWELLRDLQPCSAVSFLPLGNCTATKLVSPGPLIQTWGHVHYSQLDSSLPNVNKHYISYSGFHSLSDFLSTPIPAFIALGTHTKKK